MQSMQYAKNEIVIQKKKANVVTTKQTLMRAPQHLLSGNKNFGWSKDIKYNMSNKNLLQQGARQKILIVKRNKGNTKT